MSFIGLLRTLAAITRPPRMGHDVDVEDGAAQLAEREAETECLVPEDFNAVCRCAACVAEERAAEDELAADEPALGLRDFAPPDCNVCDLPWQRCTCPSGPQCRDCGLPMGTPQYHACPVAGTPGPTEPALTADELVGVRRLLIDYGALINLQTSPAVVGGPVDGTAEHRAAAGEPAPSPTIVQSAPPPTVDGEGPASVRDIQPSPEAGRPTSELLTEAADFLSIHASRTESGEGARAYIRDTLLPEIDARAAIFKAIEE